MTNKPKMFALSFVLIFSSSLIKDMAAFGSW